MEEFEGYHESDQFEETDERVNTFSEQFCIDIERRVQWGDNKDLYRNVLKDLELYDDNDEKLAFLKSKLIDAKKKLKASVYNDLFPIEIIKENLTERLTYYFSLDPISNVKTVIYCGDMEVEEHEYDPDSKKLFVHLDLYTRADYQGFNFANFHHFEPLIEHLQLGKFYLKLKALELNFKKKQIAEQEEELAGNNTIEKIIPSAQNVLPEKEIKSKPLYLLDVFESISRYNRIMQILVEKKLIREVSHLWIDDKKNKIKFLVVILKQLHSLGYYKNNKQLSHKEIIEISQNTFGLKMGIDSVKKTPFDHYNINYLPFASTLDK